MTAPHSNAALPASLILAGCGKMGGAMLEGWVRMGLRGDAVTVLDPHASPALVAFCDQHDIGLNPSVGSYGAPEVLVLGIKPQMLDEAAADLSPLAGPDTLVVSILAGKTIADLRARLPEAGAVVRAMPNLPASVQRGITGCAASADASAAQRATTDALLSGIGHVEWLPSEDLIDAVTAVSGSGPAYVFLLAEALADAGAKAGLPADLAQRLARATVAGAGELLHQAPESAEQLRKNVTSPNGTTAAALAVLMAEDGFGPLLERAVAAAAKRAHELAS